MTVDDVDPCPYGCDDPTSCAMPHSDCPHCAAARAEPNARPVSRETLAEATERELARAVDNIRIVRAGARAAGLTLSADDVDLVVLATVNQQEGPDR